MDDRENRPVLQIVAGKEVEEKTTTKRRSAKLDNGLTVKQEKFAEGIASGLNNSEAYCRAYDTSKMKPATIHSEACRVAADPRVSARIDQMIKEKRAKNSMQTEKQRERHSDRIWRKMWDMIEDTSTPPAVKANLLSLGAKAAGMLTEQVKIENVAAESKDIEKEIIERLQRLSA